MSIKTMICALTVGLTLTGTCAHAVPMLQTSNGDITGVTGLMVDGDIWTAMFNDGSFDDINANTPLVQADAFAQAAMTVLYDFLSTIDPASYNTDDFVGCTDTQTCYLATPYDLPGITALSRFVRVSADIPPFFLNAADLSSVTTENYPQVTYLSWESTAVPEPPLILLMASGLIGLRVTSRKRRMNA